MRFLDENAACVRDGPSVGVSTPAATAIGRARNGRVFASGLSSDVIFFSGRGFAGGHGTYRLRMHTSLRSQRQTVERLRRQSVPIALLGGGTDAYPPLVAEHFSEW